MSHLRRGARASNRFYLASGRLAHDPYVPSLTPDIYHLMSISDSELDQSLADADCVGIVTDHSTYDWERVRPQAALIVDTRNALGREITQAEASPVGVSGRPSGGGG